jgi:mycoredoxin
MARWREERVRLQALLMFEQGCCADGRATVALPLTMYTTNWCAFCRRLKSQLAAAGIEITEVNIEDDPAAAEYVMSVNGGFQTVPTLVFPDGSAMTNPSLVDVQHRLGEPATSR